MERRRAVGKRAQESKREASKVSLSKSVKKRFGQLKCKVKELIVRMEQSPLLFPKKIRKIGIGATDAPIPYSQPPNQG